MNDEIIFDGRSKRGPGRKAGCRDRVMRDGREVELIKTAWGVRINADTGKETPIMEAVVRVKSTGVLERIWYHQMRPVPSGARSRTAEVQVDNRVGATNKKLSDYDAEFAFRYNGLVRLTHAVGTVWARVIQQYDPNEPQTRMAVNPDNGELVVVPMHFYRVRMADGTVDCIPDHLLEAVGGPAYTWAWRENMPVTVLQGKVYELEAKLRGQTKMLGPEEAALLNVETRSQPDVKRTLPPAKE